MTLPEDFRSIMAPVMGAEYDTFVQALEKEEPKRGLRVNTRKLSAEKFAEISPFALTPSPLCRDAFTVALDTPIGTHPFHHAGLYYVQDPSASAAVEVLDPQPGEHILDLCAAPGGKSTHIAARLGDDPDSLLVSNEIVPRRAKILSSNLERFGARNVVVCCASPDDFAELCPDTFDAVLVDAPCSGEGMFRRDEQALQEYSREHVESCAARQSLILDSAAETVRPGGRLVYSTCTFNPLENEGVIEAFLQRHPDFSVGTITTPKLPAGRPEWANARAELSCTSRLMPHLCPGEGHFIALLHRDGDGFAESGTARTGEPLSKKESAEFAAFWKENFSISVFNTPLRHDGFIYLVPNIPRLPRILRAGICAAQLAKGRIEPTHSLYLALGIDEICKKCILSPNSPEISAFLRGETLKSDDFTGWGAVAVGDASAAWNLGFGKISGGILKNHYPKGLRNI